MTADSTSDRRALRWTLAGLGVFVLVVGGILAWARFGPNSRYPFDEAVARAEAAGLAVRVEDLEEWRSAMASGCLPQFDATVNALEAAGPPWRSGLTGPWDHEVETPWHEHAGDERMEALRVWLSANENLLADIERMARSGPLWLDTWFGTADRRVGHTMRFADILDASMLADRDAGRRLRAAVTCAVLGDAIVSGSQLTALLGSSISSRGLGGVRRELHAGEVPASVISSAMDGCAVRERVPTWRAAIRGEIAGIAATARPTEAVSIPTLDLDLPEIRWTDWARMLDFAVRVHEIDVPEFGAASRGLRDLQAPEWPEGTGSGHARSHHRLAIRDAEQRLLRIALAATVRRERDGRWPASLAELAPDFGGTVPVDPTTGTAFSFSVAGGTMRIEIPADSALRTDPDSRERVGPDLLAERGLVIEVTR